MKTRKITVTIVKNGTHGYICECKEKFDGFVLGGSGNTVEEAKEDCFIFYDEMKELEPNKDFPKLDISWHYDLPSFFNHLGIFNVSKVAEYAGISPSNFRHYVAGSKPISKTQLEKIKNAFDKIAKELQSTSIAMSV